MTTRADLTVILPNYNHARYLPRALGALLSQSVAPAEILVLDDASTDDSVTVVREFTGSSSRIRLVSNDRNLGCCATVNRGLALARGKYVYLGACDDYVLPGFIDQLVGQLEAHPRAALACGYHSTVEEQTGRIRINPSGWCAAPVYLGAEEFARRVGRTSIPGHAAIWRRERCLEVGGYLSELEWLSDWFAGLVLAFRHGICHVPRPLALMTVHPGSYSAQARRDLARNRRVLGHLLELLTSERFSDVAGAFAASGVMTLLGPDLVRAAAGRPDCWQPGVLSLLVGLPAEDYQEVLDDPDPRAQRLAGVLLGPRWLRLRQARSRRLASLVASIKGKTFEWLSQSSWRCWLQAQRGKWVANRQLRRSA